MINPPPPQRPLASRLETLQEVCGTAWCVSGCLIWFQSHALLATPLLNLPAGLGGRDTPAFLLALAIGLLALPWALRRALNGRPLMPPPAGRASPANAVRAGLIAAALLVLWSQALFLLLPELLSGTWRGFGLSGATDILMAVLWVAPLATALPEEVFFRAYAQGSMAAGFGRGAALLLVAGGFTLAHSGQGLPAMLLSVLPAALVLGILYDACGRLLAPWLTHGVVNACSFVYLGVRDLAPHRAPWLMAALVAASLATLLAERRALWQGMLRTVSALQGWRVHPAGVVSTLVAVGMTLLTAGAGLTSAAALQLSPGPAMLLTAALHWATALLVNRYARRLH